MNGPVQPGAAGPTTHYELFASLRDAGVDYLVTGTAALTLHGVPRMTHEIDLVVDPSAQNRERVQRLLAAWGYGALDASAPADSTAAVLCFRHPLAALDEITLFMPPTPEFARLRAGASAVSLVDVGIPLVGATDLRALDQSAGAAANSDDDTRREQIRKFSRWSIPARCDWLLAAARLRKGLSPEAKPMTRGLRRRYGR